MRAETSTIDPSTLMHPSSWAPGRTSRPLARHSDTTSPRDSPLAVPHDSHAFDYFEQPSPHQTGLRPYFGRRSDVSEADILLTKPQPRQVEPTTHLDLSNGASNSSSSSAYVAVSRETQPGPAFPVLRSNVGPALDNDKTYEGHLHQPSLDLPQSFASPYRAAEPSHAADWRSVHREVFGMPERHDIKGRRDRFEAYIATALEAHLRHINEPHAEVSSENQRMVQDERRERRQQSNVVYTRLLERYEQFLQDHPLVKPTDAHIRATKQEAYDRILRGNRAGRGATNNRGHA